MARRDGLGPEPFADGREQEHLQLAAVDRVLRPAIAGGDAARLGPDSLTVLGEIRELRRRNRGRGECVT